MLPIIMMMCSSLLLNHLARIPSYISTIHANIHQFSHAPALILHGAYISHALDWSDSIAVGGFPSTLLTNIESVESQIGIVVEGIILGKHGWSCLLYGNYMRIRW